MIGMTRDYRTLKNAELAEFSELLHDLDDAQWEVDSLCEGWKVSPRSTRAA